MAHSNARRNERNLARTDFEYNYTKDSFKGVDFSTPDGRCDDEHFAYLENLYRDKEKADGAALESVPGYRRIKKSFAHIGEIYGIYSHAFEVGNQKKHYLLVHKGNYLYCFLHERRDLAESLAPIAELSATPSCGFAYGGVFYLLDGEKILAVKSPTEAFVLGDSFLTKEEKEEGVLPESAAYIPLTYRDGKVFEARNMLTGYFDLEREIKPDTEPDETQGLFYRNCRVGSTRGLEVYGMEAGRRIVAIPASVVFEGEELPVLSVAEGAFAERDIKLAVIAPSVRVIAASAFRGCLSLERVLIHGTPEIRSQAFYGCTSLKVMAVKSVPSYLAADAFEGCDSVERFFCENKSVESAFACFEKTAIFYTNSLFYWQEEGTTVYIPSATDGTQSLRPSYGAEGVLSGQTYFHDYGDKGLDYTEGVSAIAVKSVPCAQYVLKKRTEEDRDRYVFVSVFAPIGKINTKDAIEGFRIALPKNTRRVVSVKLDEKEVTPTFEYTSGILTSLRVLLPRARDASVTLSVRCYGEKSEAREYDFADTASLYDAIRACRFGAVFDGRVFLSGNPALPDTVFYSVTPKRKNDSLHFAPSARLTLRDTAGRVSAFAVHPLYLAVIKDRSVYGVTRKADGALHETYEIDGWCSSPAYRKGTFTYMDEPLFLSEQGVMALKSGKAWEEGRIENRSYYIDRKLATLDDGQVAFAEWKGYLVLLIDGKIFLGDASIAENKNGVKAYEWYYLDGIGHYDGDTLCYHHLAYTPTVWDKRLTDLLVNGKELSVLGREEPVSGEVISAVTEEGITVYYTVGADGAYYLVDSYGERAGGFLNPATSLLSLEGCLYFATSDGCLFCFNTDKRGKNALVNDSTQSVLPDEIHASFYSFDGHAYRSCLLSGNVDMGVPHLLKSTLPRSLTVRAKSMPHSAFEVFARCDRGPWEKVGFGVANDTADCLDADRFVYSFEDRTSEVFADSTRAWHSKEIMITADVFESPIGIDALAYRYKMAGRVKGKTK